MNNYAISSAGIGTALQKSAAALASANNSLDESIALITAGNTVVQNPEVIGTTMKTISMFLRASKTEAEEAGIETEGMANSVSKLRKEILALANVDIMKDNKTYKSTYQILKEISEVWEDISDVSQANILEKLGGKRNANVVASIIENFDVAEQALVTSMNSLGSATEENEKYLNSIEGHINKLKVSFEELSESVINSDLVKGGVDFLTNILSLLNGIVDVFGSWSIPAAIASVAVFNSEQIGLSTAVEDGQRLFTILGKTRGQWKELHESIKRDGGNALTTFGTAISDRIKSFFGYMSKADISKSESQLKKFNEELVNNGDNFETAKTSAIAFYQSQLKGNGIFVNANAETQALGLSIAENIKNFNGQKEALESGNAAIEQYIAQQTAYTTSVKLSTLAVNGLKIALSTFAPIAVITILSTIITQAQKAIEENKRLREEAIQSAKEEASAINELYKTYQQARDEYSKNEDALDSYISAKDNLIAKLKEEGENVDALQRKYETLDQTIIVSTKKAIDSKLPDLENAIDDAWDELYNSTHSMFGISKNPITSNSSTTEWIESWIKSNPGLLQKQGVGMSSTTTFDIDISNYTKEMTDALRASSSGVLSNEAIEHYRRTLEILTKLQMDMLEDGLDDSQAYQDITNKINALSPALNKYNEELDNYNDNAAYSLILGKQITQELPKTYSEYQKYREEITKAANSSNIFRGSVDDINKAISNRLSSDISLSEYENKYQNIQAITQRLQFDIKGLSSNNKNSILNYINSEIDNEDLKIILSLDDSYFYDGLDKIKNKVKKEKIAIQLESLKTDGAIDLSKPLEEISKAQSKLKPIFDDIANRQGEVQLTIDQTTALIDTFGDKILEEFDSADGRIVVTSKDLEEYFNKVKGSKSQDLIDIITKVDEYIKTLDEAYKSGDISEYEYETQLKEYELIKETLRVRKEYIDQIQLASSSLDKYNDALEYTATLNKNLSNYNLADKLLGEFATTDKWIADFDKQARTMVDAYADNTEYGKQITNAYQNWLNDRSKENAKKFIDIWKEAYDKDVENFNSYQNIRKNILNQYANNDQAWDEFIKASETFVQELKTQYDVDLTNCKNWLDLRNELIKNELIKSNMGIDIDKVQSESAKAAIREAAAKNGTTNTISNEVEARFQSFLADKYQYEPKDDLSAKTDSEKKEKDETDDIYKKRLALIKEANIGTLSAEKEFVKQWIALNDEMYKATDPDKYKENLREIAGYIKTLMSSISEDLKQWSVDNKYDDSVIADRYAYLKKWINDMGTVSSTVANIKVELAEAEGAANDATKALSEFDKTFVETYQRGNVDLTTRPKIHNEDGSISTVYSQAGWAKQNGEYVMVHLTPIMDDGTMLTDQEIEDYIFNNISGKSDILEADKAGKKIVLKVDTGLNLTAEDINAIENGGTTAHLEEIYKITDDWDIALHNASAEWLKLNDEVEKTQVNLASLVEADKELNEQRLAIATYYADTYKLQYEQGVDREGNKYSYRDYKNDILDLQMDYGDVIDGTFLSKYIKGQDEFKAFVDDAKKKTDLSLESQLEYIDAINKKNEQLNTQDWITPKEYAENYKDITNQAIEIYKKALDEGKISVDEYARYIEERFFGMEDILGKDYIAEKNKELEDLRVSREKKYWEQQKQLVTEYYDAEIEKLQKIKDEHDKIAAAEKLQLNLIKARTELEKAKSQRNQLVFHDGTFEYMADQEAIKSAEEEVADALESIREHELDEQIKTLTESKDNALKFYTDIINVIDAFINKTEWIKESDSEIYKTIVESEYGQQEIAHQKGEIAPNNVTDKQLSDTGLSDKEQTKAGTAINTAHENKKADLGELEKTWSDYINKPVEELARQIKELAKTIGESSLGNLIFDSSGTNAQDIAASGVKNIVTNGGISNDNSVSVGDIHMTIQGGTSEEMLSQFAAKLGSAISTIVPKAVTAH